jgi:hypothetical protein
LKDFVPAVTVSSAVSDLHPFNLISILGKRKKYGGPNNLKITVDVAVSLFQRRKKF